MKRKNLLVVCAAAGLCMVFVMLLAGSMGIYAEKSGTQEFELEMEESEASDMLTRILAENGEEKAGEEAAAETDGMAEEELKNIWKKMYGEYEEAGADDPTLQEQQENTASEAKAGVHETENAENGFEEAYHVSLDDAKIGVNEAGLILLKEINRLYPEDSLEDLKIAHMNLEFDAAAYKEGTAVYWSGKLENGYGPTEESYRSYSCQIDSVSGKMASFGKFRPYQKEKDYSAISWTDAEIKERAKQLIGKYNLFQGEELDWDHAVIYSGKEEMDSLNNEFAEKADLSASVCNTLVFEKDGVPNVYFCMDWETGEISNYLCP